jgi:DNA adenine methylase Dam
MTKPLFKYIGGKTKFAKEISGVISARHEKYSEPFCGALGAFFGIEEKLYESGVREVELNDINSSIIEIYKRIHEDADAFISEYIDLEIGFAKVLPILAESKNKLKLEQAKEFYNTVRTAYNEKKRNGDNSRGIEFLFLQKHAFNGVYRENGKGEHNVPFNWNGAAIDSNSFKKHVLEIKSVFSKYKMSFVSGSVFDLEFHDDVLYYLDPPYYNDNTTENKYNKDEFDIDAQKKLIALVKDKKFIYSNHNSKFIVSEFGKDVAKKILSRKNIMAGAGGDKSTNVQEILMWSNT